MQGILIFSIFCMLCTAASKSLNQFEDSKISHIQPAPINDAEHLANKIANHHSKKEATDGKKKILSNHEILKSLGLSKLTIPPSHHRKRLAVESRHHARPDDSHMFIIKLPPNPVYYTNAKTAHDKNSVEDKNKKVSVDFKSNGKPGRIYHWNLPVLKKIVAGEGRNANLRHSNDISELIDIKHIPTWSKPWENETVEKSYRKSNAHHQEKLFKKKSPSYYAPMPKPKTSSVHKYFPGNGKPQSFYVINKGHKPFYQKLIP